MWHLSRMRDPKRVERIWLAIAVATLWLVSVGGEADAQLEASSLKPLAVPQDPSGSQSQPEPQDPSGSQSQPESQDPSEVQSQLESQKNPDVQPQSEPQKHPIPPSATTKPPRVLSCFRRGFVTILAAVFKGDPLPIGSFVPDFSAGPTPVPIFSSG